MKFSITKKLHFKHPALFYILCQVILNVCNKREIHNGFITLQTSNVMLLNGRIKVIVRCNCSNYSQLLQCIKFNTNLWLCLAIYRKKTFMPAAGFAV